MSRTNVFDRVVHLRVWRDPSQPHVKKPARFEDGYSATKKYNPN
jgi:hypothetical protein